MQDRFKFRAWIKSEKRMGLVKSIDMFSCFVSAAGGAVETLSRNDNCVVYRGEEDIILMQCTGLKDKNGKLIFEGDIIEVKYIGGQIPLFGAKYNKNPENEQFIIIYDKNWHCFRAEYINRMSTIEIHSLSLQKIQINTDHKIFKVIGNIYENPELLESEGL